MPIINLNVNYEDVQDMDKFAIVPNGTYEFTVRGIKEKPTKAGRPQLLWTLEVTDPATNKHCNIFYNSVLPWIDQSGQLNVDGVGMLVQVCKGVGLPWTGGQLVTEDYIGRSGRAEVIQRAAQKQGPDGKWVDDPDKDPMNVIKKFVY